MPFGVPTEVKGEHGCQRSKLGEIKAKMKDLRQAQKAKKDPEKSSKELDTIVIQRLSAEFSDKAQKYSRVGANELVSFEDFDELSIGNIKKSVYAIWLSVWTLSCRCPVKLST